MGDLREVPLRLAAAGLCLNRKKCALAASYVTYLGHVVDAGSMSPLPAKVEAINAMPRPTNKVELQRFLGCINFFHRFLPGVAEVLAPLHSLTASVSAQKAPLLWTSAQVDAFNTAKLSLSAAVKLSHPDPADELSLTTDTSLMEVGAVLDPSKLKFSSTFTVASFWSEVLRLNFTFEFPALSQASAALADHFAAL